ncbi:uncharacterized protein LOC120335301 [Styela clava]
MFSRESENEIELLKARYLTGCRTSIVIRFVKVATALIVFAFLLGSAMQFISQNNERMLRYEKDIQVLRAAIKDRDVAQHIRMKREIADSLESHMAAHKITKRSNRNSSNGEEEYLDRRIAGGITYLRWGRRDCPNQGITRFVYSGYMAAGHYTHTGSGANYMCLHHNVSYTPGKYVEGSQGSSYVYGVEFRDSAWVYQLFDLTSTETNSLQFHSVPCAMCMAEARVSKMMIPGRGDCPKGWHREYAGYIMSSGHSDKHSTEFICVDERPQIVPGTIGNQGGGSLQMVEVQCPSLLCEPFVVGRELRCVVCTL